MFQFLVEKNIPLAVSDGFGDILRKMCPDSAIAKKYGCARTKTTAIVKCMAEEEISATVQLTKKYGYR